MKYFKSINFLMNSLAVRLLFLAVFLNFYWTGVIQAQNVFCDTEPTAAAYNNEEDLRNMNETGPYYIRIYVHVLRKTDGTGGQSEADVKEALSYLDKSFAEHNIFFVWDCVIDYISDPEDDYYYFSFPEFDDLTDENYHENGIDIYMLDDDILHGGKARGIPGIDADTKTALVVGGTFYHFPYSSMVKSHILSHEVGHCLGLLHTHESIFGTDDGAGCVQCGDLIADTPADPKMNFNVSPPDICAWTDPIEGFNPDETNIMSYSHIDCIDNFSTDQGRRMRNSISSNSSLQMTLVKRKIINDEEWNISNTPSGIVDIEGVLEVASGAHLTITSGIIVRFAPKSKLIVKENARLTLYGTLTSKPCDDVCEENCGVSWKGVELWGDTGKHQYSVGGVRAQGKLIGRSGGLIENAEIGVKTWGNDAPDIQEGFYTKSGGQIDCFETTFRNNKIGVHFAPYKNFFPNYPGHPYAGQPRDYFATFSLCTFENNNDYQVDEHFFYFMRIIGVDGVDINGCSFINTETHEYILDGSRVIDYGIGISSSRAGFNVQPYCYDIVEPCINFAPSTFEGLGHGVDAYGTPNLNSNLSNKPFKVKQADFENCFIGVRSQNVFGATILFNNFKMGNVPEKQITVEQFGVQFDGQAYLISFEENHFFLDNADNDIYTIGTLCKNLGPFKNYVRKNYYDAISIGNLAHGLNGHDPVPIYGLIYLCNENTNIQDSPLG